MSLKLAFLIHLKILLLQADKDFRAQGTTRCSGMYSLIIHKLRFFHGYSHCEAFSSGNYVTFFFFFFPNPEIVYCLFVWFSFKKHEYINWVLNMVFNSLLTQQSSVCTSHDHFSCNMK